MEEIKTLNKNKDFNRIYSRGTSYVYPTIVVYVCRNREKSVRVGITTSKKIGNAVKRNRARRVIREAIRKTFFKIKPGFDVVMVARKRTVSQKSYEILDVLTKILEKANVLIKNEEKVGEKNDKKSFNKNNQILSKKYFNKQTGKM